MITSIDETRWGDGMTGELDERWFGVIGALLDYIELLGTHG